MNELPVIKLNRLTTGYKIKNGYKIIAKELTANLNSGELTCLLGANGAGKSTLLRTLSAIQPALSGEVTIFEKTLTDYSPQQIAKTIGVVLTEKCHVRNMTAHELVCMGRSPYTGFWGGLTSDDHVLVESAMERVGIAYLAHRLVETLSDGELQKVMIAKALAQETPVIFLDEPTAFLDFPSKVEIMQLLHRLTRNMNKTIFLSTHDLELALQIADKIWLLDREAGVTIGSPEDLSLSGTLKTFFSNKGILFDRETGLFRIENEYTRQIKLVGHGFKYAMLRKALQRNGIEGGRQFETAVFVDCGTSSNGEYILYEDGSEQTFRSIEELVKKLRERL